MDIKKIDKRLSTCTEKAYTTGVTKEDYTILKRDELSLTKYLKDHKDDKAAYQLLADIRSLNGKIFKSGLVNKFSNDNLQYIKQNAFLLPLVLSNTKSDYILHGNNSVLFDCEFHSGDTKTFRVSDISNKFKCHGCEEWGFVIDYIRKKHNLSYTKAADLVCQIYMFDCSSEDFRLFDEVRRYQDTILSQKYQDLLYRLEERLYDRNVKEIEGFGVEKSYDKRYETIERLQHDDYDPGFIYKAPPKKIILKNND